MSKWTWVRDNSGTHKPQAAVGNKGDCGLSSMFKIGASYPCLGTGRKEQRREGRLGRREEGHRDTFQLKITWVLKYKNNMIAL